MRDEPSLPAVRRPKLYDQSKMRWIGASEQEWRRRTSHIRLPFIGKAPEFKEPIRLKDRQP